MTASVRRCQGVAATAPSAAASRPSRRASGCSTRPPSCSTARLRGREHRRDRRRGGRLAGDDLRPLPEQAHVARRARSAAPSAAMTQRPFPSRRARARVAADDRPARAAAAVRGRRRPAARARRAACRDRLRRLPLRARARRAARPASRRSAQQPAQPRRCSRGERAAPPLRRRSRRDRLGAHRAPSCTSCSSGCAAGHAAATATGSPTASPCCYSRRTRVANRPRRHQHHPRPNGHLLRGNEQEAAASSTPTSPPSCEARLRLLDRPGVGVLQKALIPTQ